MTPAEADARIIFSRKTLHRYVAMVTAGELPAHDLHLMTDEIGMLEQIAERYPVKAEKAYRLGEEWLRLVEQIRAKMN